jgi:hypothetical protein
MEGKPFEDLQAIIAQIVSPQPITFSGYYMPQVLHPHVYPLYISAYVDGCRIRRVFIDRNSLPLRLQKHWGSK